MANNGSNGIEAAITRAEDTVRTLARTAALAQKIEDGALRISSISDEQAAALELGRRALELFLQNIDATNATADTLVRGHNGASARAQELARNVEHTSRGLEYLSRSIAAAKKDSDILAPSAETTAAAL